MSEADLIELEKPCPVCDETGVAQADADGEFVGAWMCKNDECPKDMFVSSRMQFYDVQTLNNNEWTWEDVKQEYQ